jgi:hypothetical protein
MGASEFSAFLTFNFEYSEKEIYMKVIRVPLFFPHHRINDKEDKGLYDLSWNLILIL